MVRKVRKTQLQFGSTAGAQEISEFGSLAAGTPEYSTNPTDIQSRSQFLAGWVAAAIGSSPAIEDENALHYLWSYQLQYVLETGIPEWDAGTTYYVGDVVSSGDQYGSIYVSVADSQTNHAITDTSYWRLQNGQPATALTSGKTLAAADNGTIIPCNTSGGAFSITLVLGGAPKGFSFTIKDTNGTFGTFPVSIVRIASETIEGVAATYVCNKPNRAYTFYSDGTNWWVKNVSFDTKNGAFVGDGGTQTAAGSNATGLNIVGNTSNQYASITQQKITAAGTSFGALITGGSNSSDTALDIQTAAGLGVAKFRGDRILEVVGGGIKFPASQIASSDANVLDDYEEGTWTPTLAYSVPGTSSFGYNVRAAGYTKVGDTVFWWVRITLSSFSRGTASGNISVAGLPFTSANNNVVSPCDLALDTWTYGAVIPVSYVSGNSVTAVLQGQASGAGLAILADPSATSTVYISGSYKV